MSKGSVPAKPQKQLANLRQYQIIWNTIKAKQPGEITHVKVHTSAVERLIQAVKKEKSAEVAVKKKIGMLTAGPLKIVHNPEIVNKKVTDYSIVEFSLTWDGSKL